MNVENDENDNGNNLNNSVYSNSTIISDLLQCDGADSVNDYEDDEDDEDDENDDEDDDKMTRPIPVVSINQILITPISDPPPWYDPYILCDQPRLPVRKTIRRDNKLIEAFSLPRCTEYNMRSARVKSSGGYRNARFRHLLFK